MAKLSDNMYDEARVTIEVVSTIICFILVRFMIKPYALTRESRYLGLPLGFSFLGISYAISAIAFLQPSNFYRELVMLQLFTRTFAFVFLATTYYFSRKPSKNSRLWWNITLSLLTVGLVAFFIIGFVAPQLALDGFRASQIYIRVFDVFCLAYIAIYTLSSHVKNPDPTTIWIPQGFILLAISQYSLLFWYVDTSFAAFWGAIALRLVALAVFLFVAYRTFYSSSKRSNE